MESTQLRILIPADWRERMERARKGKGRTRKTLSNVGRDAIRDYLERLARPGDSPLSEPVDTRGRPRKDTASATNTE
jgi:ketosteroid isomerase-like protein